MVLRKAKNGRATSARRKKPARAAVANNRRGRRGTTAIDTFPVVGVGASAGGLDAFKRFFSTIPRDCGVAFVLIQHLDPTRKSLTAELVGAYTPMAVIQAKNGMKVEANRVYVIPPNKYLTIRERTLRLSAPAAPRSLRMAVDYFLRSLAEDQHEKAIGVVLSGTGTDGTLGLREIKAAGGMTMVQDPRTAQHDGMPRSAIASGCADAVAPAEQMADALLAYARNAPIIDAGGKTPADETSDALSSTVALLHASTKCDFGGYRKGTLRRRIQRRMGLRHITEMSAYLELLRRDPAEVAALFKDLLLKVTSFFREPAAWQFLQQRVIRGLIQAKDNDGMLRVWVPACATGEEAYSVAMVVIEELQAAQKSCRLQVFASDVDVEALEAARAGVYPETIAADVSPARLSRFFIKSEHRYQVNKELRDTVVFARQNLISDPPFSKLDLVTCRNLLIYLEPAVQERLLALLHFALAEGGGLFLGSAEGVGRQHDLFDVISKKWRIYRRVGPTRHDKVQFPVASAPVVHIVSGASRQQNADRLPAFAQRLLLERYAPACVIINRNSEIVYFHGDTNEYLVQPTGPPTKNVVAQARNGLRAKLRGCVHESLLSGRRVVSDGVRVRRGSAYPRVTITVEPLETSSDKNGFWVVSFDDGGENASSVHLASDGGAAIDVADAAVVNDLEYELKTTKEELQHTIEDVKASNEELMSVNEELQSSNEELETSKEELQSLNEELTTSNAQLESKIGELEATNNDLDNLLTSTSIATVFLDTSFCIRRFTPAATKLFSLIPSDIGRPIADVVHKFTDPDLLSDAAAVVARPITPKREVQADDGRWYVRQALPYRSHDGRTEGVVITLSDVAAEALLEARLYAEAIVDTVREPLLVLDADLRVISANRAFYSEFQVSEKQTVGQPLYELGNQEWDIGELRTLLAEVLPRKKVLNDFEVAHEFRGLGRRVMLLNARALVRGGERPDLILLAIEDVTERRLVQEVLRETEARKQVEEQVHQRQAQLAHALRISTVGELASGLAHELNQPLSTIANDVEACARFVRSGNADSEKLLTLLHDASTEALRAGEIVEHLRQFIRKGEPHFELTDLVEIARHVPRLLGHEIERERISLKLDLRPTSLTVYADRIQIEQVMVNLMQNAIDSVRGSVDEPREIELAVSTLNDVAQVMVRDTGVGLSAEAVPRLFEPFFTTKPQGLGLGLAISRSVIEAHQGRIWVDPPSDGVPGTTVRFTLPLHEPKPSRRRRST
jgi:chemotaxis methyl-accepting protein methylase/signal transduction histidine kinase